MSRKKQYCEQGIAVLLMLLILLAAILYGNGVYDISFATRTPPTKDGADAPAEQPSWSLPGDADEPEEKMTSAAQLAALPSLYDGLAANKTQTADAYGGAVGLYLSGLGYGEQLPFSVRMATVASEVRIPLGGDASYRSELVYSAVEKPLFEPYMGYLLYENGTDRRLYAGTGELLLTDFPFEPAYARDANGYPLFSLGDAYFCYDAATGQMRSATYDVTVLPLVNGVLYAAPEKTPYIRFCENGKWGYKKQTETEEGVREEIVIPAEYESAFDFVKNPDPSEDRPAYAYLAVVIVGKARHIRIINTEGIVVADAYVSREYTLLEGNSLSTFEAWDGCYLPERTDNIGALGMDRIDANGFLRVRRRIVRMASPDVVPVDEDLLLRIWKNGDDYSISYFNVPTGYRLCAYTEGVLLLQDPESGAYGYYSKDGRWLTTPVFKQASPMREGLAAVATADGTMGLLSASGEWVLAPTFRYVSEVSDGVVAVYDNALGWRMLCKMKG